MQNTTVSTGGAFCFWTCATWSDQKKLQTLFSSLGLGAYAPKPMAVNVVLREALEKVLGRKTENAWTDKDVLIRPMANANSFCVMEEHKGKTENEYKQTLMCKIDTNTLKISFAPLDDRAAAVVSEFNEHRGYVSGSLVGSSLVALVKKMNGTTIRQTGGLYWLPSTHAAEWKSIGDAVEACSVYGTSRVYLASMEVNAESIRVVRDAIKAEILRESERLLDEIATGELGDKAIASRKEYLEQLEAKVKEYEGIVGESLVDLRDALSKCATAIGMAAFQAALPEGACV